MQNALPAIYGGGGGGGGGWGGETGGHQGGWGVMGFKGLEFFVFDFFF